MYFWHTDALAQELKEGTVSESEKFKYFFTLFILISIAWSTTNFFEPDEFTLSNIIQSIIDIIIVIVGTYLCYAINREGDGINFIERYVCLNFPIFIKFTVFMLFGYTILGIIFGTSFLVSDDVFANWFVYLLSTILYIYFFWRLYVHIKWISHDNTGIN